MLRRIDSVGWGFFSIVAIILLGPLCYIFVQIVGEDAEPMAPYGLGLISALFAAAVIAWVTNTALQWLNSLSRPAKKKVAHVKRADEAQPSKETKPAKTQKRSKRGKRRKQKAK